MTGRWLARTPALPAVGSAAAAVLSGHRPEPRPATTSERFDPAERRARRARGRAQKAARRVTRRCGR